MEAGQTPPPGPGGPGGPEMSEEELRARLEEEMRKVRVQDVLLDGVARLVSITARRIAKEDERDLDQARVGIEAVRAVMGLLEPEAQAQVQSALSELQMIYAQASEGGQGAGGDEGTGEEAGSAPEPPPAQQPPQQGPAGGGQAPPRLWTPHQRD